VGTTREVALRSFLEEAGVRAVRPPAKAAAVICDTIAEAILLLRLNEKFEYVHWPMKQIWELK
jgi:hypothetical protein